MNTETLRFSPAGGAGVASAVVSSQNLMGFVEAVHVSFASNIPNTTDVVLTDRHGEVILSLSNQQASQSGMYYPRRSFHTSAGSAYTWDGINAVLGRHAIYGQLIGSVLQANAIEDAVKLTVYMAH